MKHFSSYDEVIAVVDEYFADPPENHYSDGIQKLDELWNNKKYLKSNVFNFYSRNFIAQPVIIMSAPLKESTMI